MKKPCELTQALGYPAPERCALLSRRVSGPGVTVHLIDKTVEVKQKLTQEQVDARRRAVVDDAATFIRAYRRKMMPE